MKYLILILVGVITIQSIISPTYSVKVQGKSMEPFLSEEDNVIITEIRNNKDLNIGDIVLYENDNNKIMHRIMFIGEDEKGWYAFIKGDANTCPDGEKCWLEDNKLKSIVFKIRENQIIGKIENNLY